MVAVTLIFDANIRNLNKIVNALLFPYLIKEIF